MRVTHATPVTKALARFIHSRWSSGRSEQLNYPLAKVDEEVDFSPDKAEEEAAEATGSAPSEAAKEATEAPPRSVHLEPPQKARPATRSAASSAQNLLDQDLSWIIEQTCEDSPRGKGKGSKASGKGKGKSKAKGKGLRFPDAARLAFLGGRSREAQTRRTLRSRLVG